MRIKFVILYGLIVELTILKSWYRHRLLSSHERVFHALAVVGERSSYISTNPGVCTCMLAWIKLVYLSLLKRQVSSETKLK